MAGGKRVLTALLLAGLCWGVAGCSPPPPTGTQTQGGLTATFQPIPDPPKVGHDSGFSLTLTEGGQPVRGATVNMAFFFPGLNQTGPTATAQEGQPGVYTANEVSTGMGGKWEAEVTVTRPAGTQQFKFPFTVAK